MTHLIYLSFLFFTLAGTALCARNSITANFEEYLSIAEEAASNPPTFAVFRSLGAYRRALEISQGDVFAQYIQCNPKLLSHLDDFRKLDSIGAPPLSYYPDLGGFSATTLRYIFHADQMLKLFRLPDQVTIVEIGAGFGGQAHILQTLHPCSHYYIYDLPPVEALISKVMEVLGWDRVHCLSMDQLDFEGPIDLLISNYAYSECDRETQLEYFNKVIKKANRGYMIYNNISSIYGIDSLSISEFVNLLKSQGFKNVRTYNELFAENKNFLVTWDNVGKGKKGQW